MQILWASVHILTHALNNFCRPYGLQLAPDVDVIFFKSWLFANFYKTFDPWNLIPAKKRHFACLRNEIPAEIPSFKVANLDTWQNRKCGFYRYLEKHILFGSSWVTDYSRKEYIHTFSRFVSHWWQPLPNLKTGFFHVKRV